MHKTPKSRSRIDVPTQPPHLGMHPFHRAQRDCDDTLSPRTRTRSCGAVPCRTNADLAQVSFAPLCIRANQPTSTIHPADAHEQFANDACHLNSFCTDINLFAQMSFECTSSSPQTRMLLYGLKCRNRPKETRTLVGVGTRRA